MFLNFKDNISTYFPSIVDFVSQMSEKTFKFLFTKSFLSLNKQLLLSIDQNLDKKFFISIPIEQLSKFVFVSKIFKDKNIKFDHFIKNLKSHKIKTLADLYMIKSLNLFVKGDLNKYVTFVYDYFTKQNYDIFIDIEKQFFDFTLFDKNEFSYQKIVYFFNQYHNENIDFFEFKQNIEIVSSTNFNNLQANSTINVFHNSPSFSNFIRTAFFCCKDHFFDFDNFINFDTIQKENIYFPTFNYIQYEKQTGNRFLVHQYPCHEVYPNKENKFKFNPLPSLPKKIAAIRFITKYISNYFLKYQNMEFPKLNFSCDFLRMPSNCLINFISLSILQNYFSPNLKLNNEFFLNILKSLSFIFPKNSNDNIDKDHFMFITFFSGILSSKIRFVLAKNLISILENPSKNKFDDSIYLFSINEMKYAQDFIKSNNLDIYDNSYESINLFLTKLFSKNYIDQYNRTTPEKYENANDGYNHLRMQEKKPEFNLQQMFLNLESSFLNVIPGDVFLILEFYSYLILMHHSQMNDNSQITKEDIEILEKLFSLFYDLSLKENIEEKFNNSLINIIQYCNQYIYKRLQETFDFLQFFYQTYYFVSFCKIHNKYVEIPNNFKNLYTKLENAPIDLSNQFLDLLSEKIKPFPLFYEAFILFDSELYSSDIYNFDKLFPNLCKSSTDKNTEKNNENDNTEKNNDNTDKNDNNIKTDSHNISKSSLFIKSNNFYSEQFRIQLSNLSLHKKLKKYVLDSIDLLDKILNDSKNNITQFSTLPFFNDSSPQYFHFFIDENDQEDNEYNSKYAIEFYKTFDHCSKEKVSFKLFQAISSYIHLFKSKISQFLEFDPKRILEYDSNNCNKNNDTLQTEIQLLFSSNEVNHAYIQVIKNNFMNLAKIFHISNDSIRNNKIVEKKLLKNIDQLASSVLEARFNDKVEIEPIVKLIPEYENDFIESDYCDCPTNSEYMALCSSLPFVLSTKDKFRNNIIKKSKILSNIDEKEDIDDLMYTSNSLLKAGNYLTTFDYLSFDNDEELSDYQSIKYEEPIKDALNLSSTLKIHLQEKHNVRHKLWSKVIWDIFSDLFNIKLSEINLRFDLNDPQLIKFSFDFEDENYEIMKHFYALGNIPDLIEKETLIYSFIIVHIENEQEIRSAFVYAFVASYVVLKDFTSFDFF